MAASPPPGLAPSASHPHLLPCRTTRQDGAVKLWDVRAARRAAQVRAHVGAVNELLSHDLPSGQGLVLSAGADHAVLALEPRMSLKPLPPPLVSKPASWT